MSILNAGEKRIELRKLHMGDIVRCSNGKEYEFVRLKQSKFLGRRDGGTYDIPIEMFSEVVKKAENTPFDPSSLQEGELFYILNNKQEPVVFRFKYMINANKVQAENPVTNQSYTIGCNLVKGSIREWQR